MAKYLQIIGKCKRFGKSVGFQVEKTGDYDGKIVGYYELFGREFDSQAYLPTLKAKSACPKCGNMAQGGCSHGVKLCKGCVGEYCQTCDQLELDFSVSGIKSSQYGDFAGQNDIAGAKDRFGNALGSQADLGRDGAFHGKKVVILWLCCEHENGQTSCRNVTSALKQKGFVVDFNDERSSAVSSASVLKSKLTDACQFWLIADRDKKLTEEHYRVICDFYRSGRGLYLWADNTPFFKDVNEISSRLFGVTMDGDYYGDQIIGVSAGVGKPGVLRGHLLSTGIQNFYEGITISTVKGNISENGTVKPLTYDSQGGVVSAFVDAGGCRCLIDGGFTRLFHSWDKAGTDRYVKNAAVWLANVERFQHEYR